MSALPGIRAWLPPVYGPKRRYEAPTCVRDRSKVWADTITVFQARHMLATMIDPKHIVSGWMPRRVRVTDDDGNVVREMTAEQLGVKMVARGAVEFAVDGRAVSSMACPTCGGPRSFGSKSCMKCRRKHDRFVCRGCGGRKSEHAALCSSCAGQAPIHTRVCACGGSKSAESKRCAGCQAIERIAAKKTCPCGAALSTPDASLCRRCFLHEKKDAVEKKRWCPCGQRKNERSAECWTCALARRAEPGAMDRAHDGQRAKRAGGASRANKPA